MRRIQLPSRFEKVKLQRFIAPGLIILLVAVAATAGVYANKYAKTAADQQTKFNNSQTKLLETNNKLKETNNQLNQTKQEKVESEDSSKQQIQKLEEEKKDLQQQLQAKAEQKSRLASAAAAVTQKVSQAIVPVAHAQAAPSVTVAGCGDNTFANYIYSHESGCRLTVTNAEGCIGIGQACPASKLYAACPSLDYACQNAFFTGYANSRYGGWEGAYAFWLANHWW